MYKAVIFDFFGVFCPDITLHWLKQAIPDYESKLSDFHAICKKSDYGALSKEEFFKEISLLTGVNVDEVKRGVEAQTVIDRKLVKYVREHITGKFKTACLSNGTHEWTSQVITSYGLEDLFDGVVLSGDLGIVKPNPEIYKYALETLGVGAEEAIFIDDRQANVDTAQSMGMQSILFGNTRIFINDFERLLAISR